MDTSKVTTYQDLTNMIETSKTSKGVQDDALIESMKNFANAMSPIQVAKSTLHDLIRDKDVQFDLLKGSMVLGSKFIIEKFVNRQDSIKGFLSSVIIENMSSSFIEKNAPQIVLGMTKMIALLSNELDDVTKDDNSKTVHDSTNVAG